MSLSHLVGMAVAPLVYNIFLEEHSVSILKIDITISRMVVVGLLIWVSGTFHLKEIQPM